MTTSSAKNVMKASPMSLMHNIHFFSFIYFIFFCDIEIYDYFLDICESFSYSFLLIVMYYLVGNAYRASLVPMGPFTEDLPATVCFGEREGYRGRGRVSRESVKEIDGKTNMISQRGASGEISSGL